MVERLRLLDAQGIPETIEPIDESSNAYKMYKDFVVPDLPPAYAHLNLPPHWLIYMFCKREKKRSHKKSHESLMTFKELAKAIADAYKTMDADTKTWLDDVSGKLLTHNKEMREVLGAYLTKRGIKEPEPEKKVKAANGSVQAKSQDSIPSEKKTVDLLSAAASSRGSPIVSGADLDPQRRYHLLKLQAAKLSLEMQELQNSMISPAGLRREDFMMMYPNSGRAAIDQYGLSPYVNHLISPQEAASWLSMHGRAGLMPPLGRTRPEQNHRETSAAQSRSLLHEESSQKRKSSDDGEAKRDEKRAKPEFQKTSNEKGSDARSQSNSPLEQARARVASIGGTGFFPPSSGHPAFSRDALASAFHSPYPSAFQHGRAGALASLGPSGAHYGAGGLGGTSRSEQLMLGYQLGLQAAAKAQARVDTSSHHLSNEEMAARLELMGREGLSGKNDRLDREDDVAAQLEMLKRRQLNRSLDRSGAHGASFDRPRLTNDEIAARLDALGRTASPFSRFGRGDDEIARRVEALTGPLPGMMNRAEAFARSEFGLSLSDIESTFKEMKRSRQED